MNYQELVNKCKRAYADKDMDKAWALWQDINKIIDELDDIKDDEKWKSVWEKYYGYMQQFTDDEVYEITDYGKQKLYRQMEIGRVEDILNDSVSCSRLDDMKEMKSLDEFISFYEWCILKSENNNSLYNIYDLQTNEVIDSDENNGDKTLNETILRLVDKALDYELDEREYETDEEYEKCVASDYIQNLLNIQEEFIERRKEELKKELKYEEKKLEVCAYGKSDLYHIEHLKYEVEQLEER